MSYFHHRNDITVFLDLDRLQRINYKEFLLLMATPFSHFWISQQKSSKEVQVFTPRIHRPGDAWIQSLVANFLSVNPCQYKSNHEKQDLLITISKISDCLLQIQIIKSQNFFLNQPAITNSTHSLSKHTPTSHLFFNSLRKI